MKLKEEPKKLWLEALRSGEYEQGQNVLEKAGKHCCMGVLCRVAMKNGVLVNTHIKDGDKTVFDHSDQFPSKSVWNWALEEEDGSDLPVNMEQTLAKMNDSGDYDFKEIADFIEKEY